MKLRQALTIATIGAVTAAFTPAPATAGAPGDDTGAAQDAAAPETSPEAKPDHRRRYVPPITNPIYNETARITTELRPFYMYHSIPGSFVTNGGHANIVAVQARAAITERLGFIATKDGYADMHFPDSSPVSDDNDFVNIAAGFKYAFYHNPEEDSFFTLGLRYEAPTGSLDAGPIELQGGGDGFINVFVTGERPIGERFGIQSSFGLNQAIDSGHDSSFVHWSFHGDVEVFKNVFGIFEFNMISKSDNGDRTDSDALGSFEGFDVVNFGSTDSGTVFSAGFGARARITDNILFGVAYEVPVGGRKDLLDYRWTTDFVFVM